MASQGSPVTGFGPLISVLILLYLNAVLFEATRNVHREPVFDVVCPTCACNADNRTQTNPSEHIDSSCTWSHLPFTKAGHSPTPWITFLIPNVVREGAGGVRLDHFDAFLGQRELKEVRFVVGQIDEKEGTICVGDGRNEDCRARRVFEEEEMSVMLEKSGHQPSSWAMWSKQIQRLSDYIIIGELFLAGCSDSASSHAVAFLDGGLEPCPDFEYHVASVMEWLKDRLPMEKGGGFGVRVASGSSGLLIPATEFSFLLDLLAYELDGGGDWESPSVDTLMDAWALGLKKSPVAAPATARYLYEKTLFTELHPVASSSSHGTPDVCGSRLARQVGPRRADECFGRSMDPCGDSWASSVTTGDLGAVPLWFTKAVQRPERPSWIRVMAGKLIGPRTYLVLSLGGFLTLSLFRSRSRRRREGFVHFKNQSE